MKLSELKQNKIYSYIIEFEYSGEKLLYIFRFDHIEKGTYGFHIYDSGIICCDIKNDAFLVVSDDENEGNNYTLADYEVLGTLSEVTDEHLLNEFHKRIK